MTTYLYLKEEKLVEIEKSRHRLRRIVSAVFLVTGLALIINIAWPIIKFELFTQPRFLSFPDRDEIVSPLVLGDEIQSPRVEAEIDLTLLSNWFPDQKDFSNMMTNWHPSGVTDYTLSIPKLGIFDAHVKIGGTDLDESLIHYGSTTLPGELGNAVIFGHSVLPQFFNPKNYTTIFSTLPTLKEGDEVFVSYDGILYQYLVEQMKTVKPDSLRMLNQDTSDSFITLITCVPPGTYWKRLVVTARLKPQDENFRH